MPRLAAASITATVLATCWRGSASSDGQAPDAESVRLRDAIPHRRTDRRAYGDTPVPAAVLDRIRRAAESAETSLHVVPLAQTPMLAIATMHAAATELADPAYRTELTQWTHRPRWIRDGVPPEAAVEQVPRRVPVRDHALSGEALSAVMLTAAAEGLAAATISDPIEVAWPRQLLRELLTGVCYSGRSGPGRTLVAFHPPPSARAAYVHLPRTQHGG